MIPKNPDDGYLSEYFLIEYITEEGNNSQSSGNGIRILHVQTEVSEGRNGMELTYNNYSQNYDKSNQKQRVLRLVNQYGYFYPGTKGIQYTNLIDGNIEGFHWYDEEGNLTVDTDIKIEIGGCQPGPDFDPPDFDAGSSLDFENDPSFIKGSTYHITITPSDTNLQNTNRYLEGEGGWPEEYKKLYWDFYRIIVWRIPISSIQYITVPFCAIGGFFGGVGYFIGEGVADMFRKGQDVYINSGDIMNVKLVNPIDIPVY